MLAEVAYFFGNAASRTRCPYCGVKAGGEGRAAESGGGYAGYIGCCSLIIAYSVSGVEIGIVVAVFDCAV